MPAAAAKPPTVHEALAAVMAAVQAVGKDSTNTQQGYKFRGVDAVVNAVGPEFRNQGVTCVPIDVVYESEKYTSRNNAVMRSVTATVTYRFYGPAGDYIDAKVCGESADSGDKAVPKAMSVAYRTLLLQALCIPTDEPDPDSESNERVAALVNTSAPAAVAAGLNDEPAGEVAQFPPANARTRLDAVIARLIEREWITPQQIASACEASLEADAGLDDLKPVLDDLDATAMDELIRRLITYGESKKAEEAAA